MAKKKKVKSAKKVTKKTPLQKAQKKKAKKVVKKTSTKATKKKLAKKSSKKTKAVKALKPKKTSSKKIKVEKAEKVAVKPKTNTGEEAVKAKPAKKPRKKRITKAETLRLMQKEQLIKKWHALYKKLDTLETAKYNMRESFNEETAISHVKLGWGFVLSNTNDRLEVLFEDGIKNLISNYKSR